MLAVSQVRLKLVILRVQYIGHRFIFFVVALIIMTLYLETKIQSTNSVQKCLQQ